MLNNAGRLPKKKGETPKKAADALRYYAIAWVAESTPGRRTVAKMRLEWLLQRMTAEELAHYYDGVYALNHPAEPQA